MKTQMKRGILLIMVLGVVAMAMVPASFDSDADTETRYVSGYIVESTASNNLPLEGVTATLMSGTDTLSQQITDTDGYFTLEFQVTDGAIPSLRISFEMEGYTVRSCMYTTKVADNPYLQLDLTGAPYSAVTHTYSISSDANGMWPVIMVASYGTITGVVSYDDGNVRGATVSVVSALNPNETFSTTTDSNGNYTIRCSTGSYILSVSCKGFNNTDNIFITVETESIISNVTLTESTQQMYLGLDLAHLLMIAGVLLGIALALGAWGVSRHINSSDSNDIIIDDSEEQDIKP